MPEMDGFEAAQAIRADSRFANIPILAMTANAMASDREACLEVGMNDHVPKPIEPKEFYRALVKWLQK
jgi:polar amino acid transport system substrate-binding protein